MKLDIISICKIKDKKAVKDLYRASFPKEEQLPWFILRLAAIHRDIDISCFYNGETLCGFTFTIQTDKIMYIMFLAVKKEFQSMGYGSEILSIYKTNHAEKQIVLIVEPLNADADNYNDRVRRIRFYEKNGFSDTGYDIKEVGGLFRILSTSSSIDTEEYLKVYKKLSFGLWKPKITKI